MSENNLSPESKFSLTIKELIAGAVGFTSLIAVYFSLQADIAIAKELPKPTITRTEFDLKDQLVRETIMKIEEKVQDNGEKLDLIEERLYEISQQRK